MQILLTVIFTLLSLISFANDSIKNILLTSNKNILGASFSTQFQNSTNKDLYNPTIYYYSINGILSVGGYTRRPQKRIVHKDIILSFQFSPSLVSNTDSLNLTGNSFAFKAGYGFDLFSLKNNFDFVPTISLSAGRKNLNIEEQKLYNPNISAITGLIIRTQIKKTNISLGCNLGLDLSKPNWKGKSENIINLRKERQHYYEAFLAIGYNFIN